MSLVRVQPGELFSCYSVFSNFSRPPLFNDGVTGLPRHICRAAAALALSLALLAALAFSSRPSDASAAEMVKRVKGSFSPSLAVTDDGIYIGRYTADGGISAELVRRGEPSVQVFNQRRKNLAPQIALAASSRVAVANLSFEKSAGEQGDWLLVSSVLAAGPVGQRMKRISSEPSCEVVVDGRIIVQEVCHGNKTKINVYELSRGMVVRRATYPLAPRVITTTPLARPNGLIFDLQGRTLSVTSEHRVHLIDVMSGKIKRRYLSKKPLWGGAMLTDGTVVAYPAIFQNNRGAFGSYTFSEFLVFGKSDAPTTVQLPGANFEPLGTVGDRALFGRADGPYLDPWDVYAIRPPSFETWQQYARLPSTGVIHDSRIFWSEEACGLLTIRAKPLLEPFTEPTAQPCPKP